jgi:hypothetical protein
MATAKLPEIPDYLPAAKEFERSKVSQDFWNFTGADGRPRSESEWFQLIQQIEAVPEWKAKVESVKKLLDEWNSFNALYPKWVENIKERLQEKSNLFRADDDASSESQEIRWMRERLTNILWSLKDVGSPAEAKAKEQPADVLKAIEALDKQAQATRAKLTEISSRNGATSPGPKLKDVFAAFRAYLKQWELTKGAFTKIEQVPSAEVKKALDGFAVEAEAAWTLDNPKPSAAVGSPKTAAPPTPPPGEKSAPPMSETKAIGKDTWLLIAAVGLGAAALLYGGKKR